MAESAKIYTTPEPDFSVLRGFLYGTQFLRSGGESSEFRRVMSVLWNSGNGYRIAIEHQMQQITANVSRLKQELRLIVPANKYAIYIYKYKETRDHDRLFFFSFSPSLISLSRDSHSAPASLYIDPINKDCPISPILSSLHQIFLMMRTSEGRQRHLDSLRAEGLSEIADETERICNAYGDTPEAQVCTVAPPLINCSSLLEL